MSNATKTAGSGAGAKAPAAPTAPTAQTTQPAQPAAAIVDDQVTDVIEDAGNESEAVEAVSGSRLSFPRKFVLVSGKHRRNDGTIASAGEKILLTETSYRNFKDKFREIAAADVSE